MLRSDSRKIKQGDTFIAICGQYSDGHQYIDDAIQKGATKIIAEYGDYDVETEIVSNTKEYIKSYIKSYQEEIKDMHFIGMTGTNGKTTSCYLLYQALNQSGKKCAYIGTIGFYINGKVRELSNTTPGILELYEMLIEAKKEGCTYVVMEVSSHALEQQRVYGIEYDIVLITNLTRDHLDYHKTMESYAKAKQKLFYQLKIDGLAIIPTFIDFYSLFTLPMNHNVTYGKDGDYQIKDMQLDKDKSKFILVYNGLEKKYETTLIGEHNIYNVINVIIVLEYLNINNIENVILKLTSPPGRMDKITYQSNQIIVDYAHTPDAVENVLKLIKKIATGNICVIIGCGGNRDKEKRPIMASIATKYADFVIFTSDNPRDEDPAIIVNDMIINLETKNYEVEIDRKKAIHKGIDKCNQNDILLILGKGHEDYQIVKGVKHFFDDKQEVLNYIK